MMFLITSFVLCAWSLHPAQIMDRFEEDFSLILTAVAFKLVLTEMLPKVGYLTTLDIYILSGFVFLALATVSHAALPMYFYKKTDESPLTVPPATFEEEQAFVDADMISFYVCAAIWTSWNIGYTIYFIF